MVALQFYGQRPLQFYGVQPLQIMFDQQNLGVRGPYYSKCSGPLLFYGRQ